MWFLALAILGVQTAVRYPEEARFLLRAFNPACLTAFSGSAGTPIVGFKNAFLSLFGVILCVTGAEALYADMGHFGYKAMMTMVFCGPPRIDDPVLRTVLLCHFAGTGYSAISPIGLRNS